jgi:tubulin-specific chaperone C
MNETENKD